MKFYIGMFLLLLPALAVGQSNPQRVLGSFIFDKKSYNYEFTKENINSYSLRISSAMKNFKADHANPMGKPTDESANPRDTASTPLKELTPRDSSRSATPKSDSTETSNELPTAIFSEFTKLTFETIFLEQMEELYGLAKTNTLKEKATEIFFIIQARLEFIDDEPVTAYAILRKDLIYSFLKSNTSTFRDGSLSKSIARHYIKRVSIETEDGAIKNLIVQVVNPTVNQIAVQSPRSFLEFKNQYPISISGKFDPEKFADVNLYCYNCNGIDGLSRYIRLSNLLILDIVLENDKEDYSPSNRVITLTPAKPIEELKKERRSRILEVSTFTDLAGLNQDQPNGLIQIEAKRKINIATKSRLLIRSRDNEDVVSKIDVSEIDDSGTESAAGPANSVDTLKWPKIYTIMLKKQPNETTAKTIPLTVHNRKFRSPYYSIFSSVEPKLLFSKLEQNNRTLDSTLVKDNTISPLKLYQYQIWSFGATINVLKLSFPQLKFNWTVLSFGGAFFRTRVGNAPDSVSTPSTALNSSYLLFNTNIVFRPDNRWGASIGLDYIQPTLWNDVYSLKSGNALVQPYFDGYLKTSDSGKMFFRFRWIYEKGKLDSNFTQIQIGYSINLFANSGNNSKKTN
jgi:hypothetical protein